MVQRPGLVCRPLAMHPTRGQEEEAAEEREGKEEKGEKRETVGVRRGPPGRLAWRPRLSVCILLAASLRCRRPRLPFGQLAGRACGPLRAPLPAQSGPACGPAGVGTVTVAKCANLCHCPQARGSHGDWLI